MRKLAHRGDAKNGQINRACLDRISWDDLRVLLVCTKTTSFRDAAKSLRLCQSTVTRRVERLEEGLGVLLFNRLPDGIRLTAEGRQIAESARAMEAALCDLERKRNLLDNTRRGTVTVAVTEGLGSYWLMPRLVEFQREHPHIAINLFCAMDSVDVLRLEADIAIQFSRPTSPDVITTRLGKLHIYPFAAQDYLDIYGVPTGAHEICNHRLVQQVAPQVSSRAFEDYFDVQDPESNIAIRTNASTAHLYAIEKGAGIGGLPTFAAALGAPVVPVDIGPGHALEIWMTYHPDTRKLPHKSLTIDWLRQIFDPAIYPWFADAFIHPKKFPKLMPRQAATNDGRGFLSTDPPALRPSKARLFQET